MYKTLLFTDTISRNGSYYKWRNFYESHWNCKKNRRPRTGRHTKKKSDGHCESVKVTRWKFSQTGKGNYIKKNTPRSGSLEALQKEYAEALASASGQSVCITDRDQVIAVAGGIKKESIGTPVTGQLEEIMSEREYVISDVQSKNPVKITRDDSDETMPQVISPILCEGDVIGSVILRCRDIRHPIGETEQALVKCAAGFMGRQMEQ